MDRFIIKEPRSGASAGYPTGHQAVAFSETQPNNINNMVPEAMYYQERYGNEYPSMQQQAIVMNNNVNQGFMRVVQANTFPQQGLNMQPHTGQTTSGIDPNYLSAYSSNNASYIASTERSPLINPPPRFGCGYENRNSIGAERIKGSFQNIPTAIPNENRNIFAESRNREVVVKNSSIQSLGNQFNKENYNRKGESPVARLRNAQTPSIIKMEDTTVGEEIKVLSRADKIKALHKSGPRAFSGPVEKVLKWHKALQEIGLLVIYEIVAKCVSVRPGESCAKHLVIRDDNGPAMQVVYYEIDFLLPELKAGCVVRIVGRMMAGTSRFQAFNVRPATGDDVATLSRRAAVATHHVSKLCKEYGVNQ